MQDHTDALEKLNYHLPLREKLSSTHQIIQQSLPFIARISVAIYDPKTRVLKTFIHSSEDEDPLENYQAPIDDVPSLAMIMKTGLPRLINFHGEGDRGSREHTRRIRRAGYSASYTMPIFNDGEFIGFVFFNSREPGVFDEKALSQVDIFGHLISLMIIKELSNIQVLTAALRTTSKLAHARDPETGSHVDRMSRYSRLIASALADKYRLDDDFIEHVFMFSPLHDIGKIAIPDHILMKPGKLDDKEMDVMKQHTVRGRELIDDMLENFGLDGFEHMDILRNIAEYHHEMMNGKGYPAGKKGPEIPIEARIVAVADVFDALTSRRPYKEAWSNDAAFDKLTRLTGDMLDRDCVTALIDNRAAVEKIQQIFCEDYYG